MNIQKTLEKLNKKMNDADIGAEIGASQSIVNRLRSGKHKQTFYERAEAIKKLAIANDSLVVD